MSNEEKSDVQKIAASYYQSHPQEMLADVGTKKSISIGLPKESTHEKRVCLSPEGVAILVNNGFSVVVETQAGLKAMHSDQEYSDAGAKIVDSAKEAFQNEIVMKVMPPNIEEIDLMKNNQTLISGLLLPVAKREYFEALGRKKITAIAFEFIEDKVGGLPIVLAMSEIAGSTVMLIAAEYLSSYNNGKGIILGGVTGVPPSKVVIIGSGTVAEYAARTSMGLGAEVKVFDNDIYKLKKLKEKLGNHHLYTSTIDSGILEDALIRADVVIGAMRGNKGRCPVIITEEMVSKMQENSVIIDVSIDQGGCVETSEVTTHQKPTFKKYGVIHYCVPNIASGISRTATSALSNILAPILIKVGELAGTDEMIFRNTWFSKGVYSYKGCITNKSIGDRFFLKYKNLDLIVMASMNK